VNILRGRFVETEPLYRRALAAYRASVGPRHPAVARTLHSLALTYHSLGQFDQADQLYQQAMEVFGEGLGDDSPTIAETRTEFAAMLTEMGAPARAEHEVRAALATFNRAPGNWDLRRAYAQASLGFALRKQGRLEEAAEAFEAGLAAIERIRGTGSSDLPPGLTELALIRLEQGRLVEAEELVRRAIAIRQRDAALTPWGFARSQTVLARVRAAQGDREGALGEIRRATAVMRDRLDVGARSSSLTLGETVKEREVFERHLEIAYPLLDAGREDLLAELFEVAQFPQLTGTAAAISRMAARFARGEDSLGRLLRQRQDAIEAWTSRDHRLRDLLASKADAAAIIEALRAELKVLDSRIRELDAELQSRFPDFAQLTQPRPISLEETQDLLAADEALLIQVTTEAETYLFFVRSDAALVARTPLTRERLTADVTNLRSGLELRTTLRALPPFDVEAAHRLYRHLLAPFEGEIADLHNLVFVPDGAMQNLTPSVLLTRPAPEASSAYRGEASDRFRQLAFFGLEKAFSIVPSVSALKGLRMIAASARAPRPFVGFGDPTFGGPGGDRRGLTPDQVFAGATEIDLRSLRESLVPLADTRDELRALAASFGAAEDDIFLGPRATEAAVRSLDLSAYRTVAFATHALVAGEFQGIAEPALILTIPDAGEAPAEADGVLLASEVASLELNADWVLLSACNTAAPAGRPGAEGLSGLAQAFFYAGAHSLLVSHWMVVSSAAVKLTTTAAQELRRDQSITRAEALRGAMRHVAHDSRSAHPLFWAPFVVVGAEPARDRNQQEIPK
jgi:CHAT domain-containing protein